MTTTTRTILDLAATDLMSRDMVTIPRTLSLREAAHLLRQADVTGAPVVDERGRCVGVLSAVDFLRWAEEDRAAVEVPDIRTCRYQMKERLEPRQEAVVCTLSEGACPLQVMQPATGGRRIAVCLMPYDVQSDWQQVEDTPDGEVGKYMTRDIVTVKPDTLVKDLARMMIDAHIHRVVVADEHGSPIGVVSTTDVLAALIQEVADFPGQGDS